MRSLGYMYLEAVGGYPGLIRCTDHLAVNAKPCFRSKEDRNSKKHTGTGLIKSDLIGHETSDLVVHFPSLPRRNRVLGYPEGIGGATKLGIFLEGLDPADLQF